MRRIRADDGNISLLTLGFLVLTMVLVLVISAATAIHIQYMRLVHLADELAIDAADSLDVPSYYAGAVALPRDDAAIAVAPGRMEGEVLKHAQERASEQLDGVRVVSVITPDASTAMVTVTMTVHPILALEPLLPFLDGIELRATSTARHF